jgi:hypothetical protein
MMSKLVPCSEEDFLDQDKPIRGQNYVCISFVSPEDVIQQKDIFMLDKYLDQFKSSMNELFDGLGRTYPNDVDALNTIKERFAPLFDKEGGMALQQEFNTFKTAHQDLQSEFDERNQGRTSIRGIKVRGAYDTLREAQVRSEVLKRVDNKHNIYIAQMGCWCPWSPNPDEIQDQEYAETQLNTLMKEYNDNMMQKEVFYEERKNDLKRLAVEKNKATVSEQESALPDQTQQVDPWLARKLEQVPPKDDSDSSE